MIYTDYHMHTCFGDGRHTPEEMVQSAIQKGLKVVGISEHAHYGAPSSYAMSEGSTLEYRREMARLKDAYADRIKVLCGIEMDLDARDDPEAYDYVVASVHNLWIKGEKYEVDQSPEETLRCIRQGFGGDLYGYAEAYFERVARLREKMPVDIVGHFDLLTKFQDCGCAFDVRHARYVSAWKAAMDALGDALYEVNTGAISRGYRTTPYPDMPILAEMKRRGIRLVLSSDSHSKENIAFEFDKAQALLESLGFAKQQGFGKIGADIFV